MSQFILIEELTEVLEAVEWAYIDGSVACPWCKGKRASQGHYADCPRQAALEHAHLIMPTVRVLVP